MKREFIHKLKFNVAVLKDTSEDVLKNVWNKTEGRESNIKK